VAIDNGQQSIAAMVKRSKIVLIFTYEWPQTNFSECLYVDHPVVSIVEGLNCTSIFKPYYDFFIEQKVYHESSESLIEHLNTMNIDEWWSNLIRMEEYQAFKHTFLRKV